jgi:hypothetical protein
MVVFVDRGEDAEEGLTVAVVLEDCLLFVSPLNNMVHSSGVFDSQRTSQGRRISDEKTEVKY